VLTATAVGQWGACYKPGDVSPADAAAIASTGASAEIVLWHNWVNSQNKIKLLNSTCVLAEGTDWGLLL